MVKDTLRIALHLPFLLCDVSLVLTVPTEEPDENTDTHNGKTHIEMPSMEHSRYCNRTNRGQHQQKGRLALGQLFLFGHSLLLRSAAMSTLHPSGALS